MESIRTKFERSREKFRQNMQQAEKNTRHTIFLQDDELPSSSKNTPPTKRRNPKEKGRTTPLQPRSNRATKNTTKARNFRMRETTPPSTNPTPAPETEKRPDIDIIYISDEEAPPPPKLHEEIFPKPASQIEDTEETRGTIDQTPPPPLWDADCLSVSDLEIDPEDLNDPLVLEFCRSFWGMSDTTLDRRPPTPPSPTSSFSSLDWESENFRPPTPPRRQGFVSFEAQDRQYPYLGLQCYERIWRAQVLVPRTTTTAAITNHTYQPTKEAIERGPALIPARSDSQDLTVPITPDRPFSTSPVPPPPPLCQQTSLGLLPEEIQKDILERREAHKGKRLRFSKKIWGREYRINITRGGEIKINRL